MPINDYTCKQCTTEYEDEFKAPEVCPVCAGTEFELTTKWSNRKVGAVDNSRYCTDGYTINRFQAKHDPLCQIEVGLRNAGHSSLRTFTPEQAAEFRAKVATEDSPKLRQQILDTRDRNLSDRKIARQLRSNPQ